MLCSEGWIFTNFIHIFNSLQLTFRHCRLQCTGISQNVFSQFNTECCIAVDNGEELPEMSNKAQNMFYGMKNVSLTGVRGG